MQPNPIILQRTQKAVPYPRSVPSEIELPDPVIALFSYRKVFYRKSKRALDVVISGTLLALALPLFLLIAVLIKLMDPGPLFFRHRRLGKGGQEFWCIKFRTMVADAEEQLKRNPQLQRQFETNYKIKDDPRVTRHGAFLRRTSLDELPQLWHVVRGEMSLIGPRPIVRSEVPKYGSYALKLGTVKPGLSGLWQVCGRSDTSYAERVQMDMLYIEHRSLSLDLLLILLTPFSVLKRKGAC